MKNTEKHIDEVFDEISHNIRKTISKYEFYLVDTRSSMIDTIDETRNKVKKISNSQSNDEEHISYLLQNMKDDLLDAASEIKGIGQEMGNVKGYEIENISNELIDFIEEELDEIASLLIPSTYK